MREAGRGEYVSLTEGVIHAEEGVRGEGGACVDTGWGVRVEGVYV